MRAAILVLAMLAAAPARADRPRLPPPPSAPMTPITARVVAWQISGKAVIITLDRGGDTGVATGLHGRLGDDHGRAVPHGDFTILRVMRRESIAKVAVPVAVVEHGVHAIIEPP
jgi:hypothetical protein